MTTVLMMRAYMKLLAPRPPGNIHTRQRVELTALPRLEEEVTTGILCTGRQLRKERRYVEIATRSTGAVGRELFNGAMTLTGWGGRSVPNPSATESMLKASSFDPSRAASAASLAPAMTARPRCLSRTPRG